MRNEFEGNKGRLWKKREVRVGAGSEEERKVEEKRNDGLDTRQSTLGTRHSICMLSAGLDCVLGCCRLPVFSLSSACLLPVFCLPVFCLLFVCFSLLHRVLHNFFFFLHFFYLDISHICKIKIGVLSVRGLISPPKGTEGRRDRRLSEHTLCHRLPNPIQQRLQTQKNKIQ